MRFAIVAGPPGSGKTSLLLHALAQVRSAGIEPGVFKLDALSTDDRDRFTGRNVSVEVSKDLGPVGIGELHVIEVNGAGDVVEIVGTGTLDNVRAFVKNLEDSLGAGLRSLTHHDELSEHHEGCLKHE